MDLPDAFLERLREQLSAEDCERSLSAMAEAPRTLFRSNGLLCTPEALKRELEGDGFDVSEVTSPGLNCFEVGEAQRRSLTESNAFYDGRLYIQNPSSQLAARLLEAKRGEAVLDLAAAPGGKTLVLAEAMENEGELVAVEAIKGRFHKLRANLERGGVRIADCFLMDGRAAGRRWSERFDRVLLDAPCSSEARFVPGDERSWEHWSLRKIKETSRKQKRLILAAFEALKPGGRLLYSTCSFAPEENECIVQSLIKRVGDAVEVLPLELEIENARPGLEGWQKKRFREDVSHTKRILPDGLYDGFFVASLRKRS